MKDNNKAKKIVFKSFKKYASLTDDMFDLFLEKSNDFYDDNSMDYINDYFFDFIYDRVVNSKDSYNLNVNLRADKISKTVRFRVGNIHFEVDLDYIIPPFCEDELLQPSIKLNTIRYANV